MSAAPTSRWRRPTRTQTSRIAPSVAAGRGRSTSWRHVFIFYVLALYGPMICIYILSFQDVRGGLVFPMKGLFAALVRRSLHPGSHRRCQGRVRPLNQARRSRDNHHRGGLLHGRRWHSVGAFRGDNIVFVSDDRQPGRAGTGARHRRGPSVQRDRRRDDLVRLGARRAAVLDAAVRRAGDVRGHVALRSAPGRRPPRSRRDAPGRRYGSSIIPILAPGLVAVALFGFTLSYDEFARTLQTAGPQNTLPLEIWSMTLNVTSPSLYALGTVTTIISFVIIGVALGHHRADPEAAWQPRPASLNGGA